MSDFRYLNSESIIEYPKRPPMPVIRTIVFLFGLIPLYLTKDLWHFNIFIIFALGAATLSSLFLFAALFGLNEYARFDANTATFIYGYETGVNKYREKIFPFSDIEKVFLHESISSDGPPSYSVSVQLTHRRIKSFPVSSSEEGYIWINAINKMLQRSKKNGTFMTDSSKNNTGNTSKKSGLFTEIFGPPTQTRHYSSGNKTRDTKQIQEGAHFKRKATPSKKGLGIEVDSGVSFKWPRVLKLTALIIGAFAIVAGFYAIYTAYLGKIDLSTYSVKSHKASSHRAIKNKNAELKDEEFRQIARRDHHVRGITINENGMTYSAAPEGIFAFAETTSVRDTSDFVLNQKYSKDLHFEIHKRHNGGRLIGFISEDTSKALARFGLQANAQMTLYNYWWSGAPNMYLLDFCLIKPGFSSRSTKTDKGQSVLVLDITIQLPYSCNKL